MKVIAKFILLLFLVTLFSCQHNKTKEPFYKAMEYIQLEGIVLDVSKGERLELALFALDTKNHPMKLLAIENYEGTGNALAFKIDLHMAQAEPFNAVELRGRILNNGKLVGYLSPWYKKQLTEKDMKGIILERAGGNH